MWRWYGSESTVAKFSHGESRRLESLLHSCGLDLANPIDGEGKVVAILGMQWHGGICRE